MFWFSLLSSVPVVGKTAVCKVPGTLLFPSLTVFVACDEVWDKGEERVFVFIGEPDLCV